MAARGYPSYYDQARETVEELVDTPTVKDIYAKLARLGQGNVYLGYQPNGIDDTAAMRQLLADGKASGKTASMTAYGTISLGILPGLELDPTGLGKGSGLDVQGDIRRTWDPLINGPLGGPDATLGGLLAGNGNENAQCAPGFDFTWTGKHYYDPPLTWEGYVQSFDSTTITVKFKPGWVPAFDTMNVLHGYVGDLRKFSAFEFRGKGSQLNYPVIVQPDGVTGILYPPVVTGTVSGVSNYNPLEVMISATGNLYDGIAVGASTFVGLETGSGNGLNGVAGLTLSINDDFPNRAIVLLNGAQIDASTWTPYISGGLFTSPRVPVWIANGMEVVGVVRKRGQAEIDPRFAKDWNIEGTVGQAQGVFLKGKFWENVRARIKTQPSGRLSGTAGGVILAEVRGRVDVDVEAINYGDDGYNTAPVKWGPQLVSVNGTISVTVDATKVWPPRIGDTIAFEKSGTRYLRQVTSVTFGTTDPVTGIRPAEVFCNPPAGVDSTWDITNLATDCKAKLGDTTVEGAARGVLLQSSSARIVGVTAKNMRGQVIRGQNPNSFAHPNQGSFKGGSLVGPIRGENVATDYVDKANGAITWRQLGATGPVPGMKPLVHESIYLNGVGFSAVWTEGVPLFCPQITLLNIGTERATNPRTISDQNNPGNFEFVAIASTQEYGRLNQEALLFARAFLQYGGNVIIGNRGQGLMSMTPGADVTVSYLAYGAVEATGAFTGTPKVTLLPAFAQNGDPFTFKHNGTGASIQVWDGASNTQLGMAAPSNRVQCRFRNGNWVMF